MREKVITRTFHVTRVKATLYNTQTKELEYCENDIPEWDGNTKMFTPIPELKIVDTEVLAIYERKYSMSISDFMKYSKEV